MRKDKTSDRNLTLGARIFIAFTVFSLIVIGILWLFQTMFLDDIYRGIKTRELGRCAGEVAEGLDSVRDDEFIEELQKIADKNAKKHSVCITIYEISRAGFGKYGELVCENHVNAFCFIHNVHSEDLVNRLYKKAVENDGEYGEEISLSEIFGGEENSGENIIYVTLVDHGSSELLVILNTELMALEATASTLKAELIFITIVLIGIGFVLSLFLARRIANPIRKMSNEASKLALGDYNVNFDGGYSRETANLSATLNRAAYELSKLDRMQKDLIANVSHDLRTPLTMIAGYTEAMRDLPGEATPENMQIVIDETQRLTRLVNDMLEISKYQNGAQIINRMNFNLTSTVRSTIERYAKLMEREGYNITFEADEDVYVKADESRILQVIYNLLSNAVNYTGDDKSVVITQTVKQVREIKYVTISVTDTGVGIPQDELPLVWERYYKARDFHKRANMGTGLGLSIVKNILILHGAEFGVESKVGEGSTFWFTMRVTEE